MSISLPKQHKVLHLLSEGGALVVRTVDVPSPGPNDVLLRVEAAGLNPLDFKIQDDGLFTTEYPAILGFDAAGFIAAVGSNVDRLQVGDRVLVEGHFTSETRAFQQHLVTPADWVARIPDIVSFDEAATLAVSVTTAVTTLYNPNEASRSVHLTPSWEKAGMDKYAGKPVVVLGGASAVGQAVIQFMKLSGFSPIITTASVHNTAFVQSFGATHIVDRTLPRATIVETIRRFAGGLVDLVYDAVSVVETQELGYEIVSTGGSLIILVPEEIDRRKISSKNVNVIIAAGFFAVPENGEIGAQFTIEFERLLRDRILKPGVPEVLDGGLSAVQGGLDRLKAVGVSGKKLVVHPQET